MHSCYQCSRESDTSWITFSFRAGGGGETGDILLVKVKDISLFLVKGVLIYA